MIDHKLIELIEGVGYINKHGKHIYGTAALLHILHRPVHSLKPQHIATGKTFVQKCLSV